MYPQLAWRLEAWKMGKVTSKEEHRRVALYGLYFKHFFVGIMRKKRKDDDSQTTT